MKNKIKLANVTVGEVRNLLVQEATATEPGVTVEQLLAKIIEDPRTRHIYVVDEQGKLIGAVRMNRIIEYLFPFTAVLSRATEFAIWQIPELGSRTVADIMNTEPHWVEESTPLSDMAEILMREKINELPVVDTERRIIGQVSIYEVITKYLDQIAGKRSDDKKQAD